jgi:hypothetical protein
MATTIEKQTTTEAITITRPPILERVERIRAVRQSSRMGVGISHAGTSLTDAARAFLRDATTWPGGPPPGPPPVLHPAFVEWLMGFPTEWTALGLSEMPLFRLALK